MARLAKNIFFIIMLSISFNGFAFSFHSLFHHSHHRGQEDYIDAKEDFESYCTQKPANYGFQIQCSLPDEQSSFKFDASATVKCRQITKGVNNNYPDQVDLPIGFIQKMHLCTDGKVYGPHVLHTSDIAESTDNNALQKDHTTTFYDVVCNNSESYSITMYKTQQDQYDGAITQKTNQCISNIDAAKSSRKYILAFKILFGLAVFSFILRFYFTYKQKIFNFFKRK